MCIDECCVFKNKGFLLSPSFSLLSQCVSVEQLEVLSRVCQERLASQQYQQVADIILIMASVGRHSLHFPLPLKTSLLEVISST